MEKILNENLLLITGKAFLEKGLNWGEDVQLLVDGNVLKTEKIDNQDGTYDLLHKVKLIKVKISK